jgi:hypothetical protein
MRMSSVRNGMKECRLCHEVKPVSEFHTQKSRDGLGVYVKYCCKVCGAAETKRQYHSNPSIRAKTAARAIVWAKNNPEKMVKIIRRSNLKSTYGLSEEDYEAMRTAQGDRCKLCGVAENGRDNPGSKRQTRHWYVDHCHKTGRVRGLLCHACNTRLGSFEAIVDTIGLPGILAYIAGDTPHGSLLP